MVLRGSARADLSIDGFFDSWMRSVDSSISGFLLELICFARFRGLPSPCAATIFCRSLLAYLFHPNSVRGRSIRPLDACMVCQSCPTLDKPVPVNCSLFHSPLRGFPFTFFFGFLSGGGNVRVCRVIFDKILLSPFPFLPLMVFFPPPFLCCCFLRSHSFMGIATAKLKHFPDFLPLFTTRLRLFTRPPPVRDPRTSRVF